MTRFHEFLEAEGENAVLVRVADAKGSVPREAGTVMAVTADTISGTIGGGRLEWEAIASARQMLEKGAGRFDMTVLERALGPSIGQCCGGRVRLEMRRASKRDVRQARERFTEDWVTQPPVLVFGAGHVGQALAYAFAPLPLRTTFIDERVDAVRALPEGTDWELTAIPESVVRDAGAGTCYVILTHSHATDFEIATAALRRGDAAYVGMIGSATKRAKFLSHARRNGLAAEAAEQLNCPMAPHARRDKRPEVIAAFVAAEVLGAALRSRGAGAVIDRPLAQHRPGPIHA